jgi:hypothetical protein
LARHCTGAPARVQAGIAAYRRSVLGNLSRAVEATYPVLCRITSDEFIRAAAWCYACERPSTSGDLNAYGHDFGEFLSRWPPATELPWLPEVARLEWRVQQTHDAPDAPPLEMSALQTLAPEHWAALRFTPDPAHAVMVSRWPLARIWQVNQTDYTGDMQVDFSLAQGVLIQRRGGRVVVEEIKQGEAALLQALSTRATLGDAVDAATRLDAGFDLAAALQRLLTCGLLRQAHLEETS